MAYISPKTIEAVREAARVEEVISEFVQLKRSGSNLRGFSPFNNERTPSFFVSPSKQIWKDFSSGKGGDVIKFLMEHEKFTYPEAIRWLARKYNIEIEERELTEEERQEQQEKESLYIVTEFAKKWFIEQLYHTDEGKSVGLSYFKQRGFLENTLQVFDIGYSPAKRDAFYQAALKKGFKEDILLKAGLIIKKNERVFDRFYERVIFPIHGLSGTVAGFAGRILRNDIKAAKYINSPETEIYHKSKILYGIYQAKSSIVKEDEVFLVEGYTDVMSFYQSGIKNTVASAGTSLTDEQVKLIKRFTKNVTLVYDGDTAGIQAAMRGVDIILENDVNVHVVVLPEGEDPDSFARKVSTEDLINYLESNKKDFIRFKAEWLLKDNKDPLRTFDLINEVLKSIAGIPNKIKQELYIREIATLTGTNERTLFVELGKIIRRKITGRHKQLRQSIPEPKMKVEISPRTHINKREILEKEIIKLLLLFGNMKVKFIEYHNAGMEDGEFQINKTEVERSVAEKIFLELQADEIEFTSPEFKAVFDILKEEYDSKGEINASEIIKKIPTEYTDLISEILLSTEKYKLSDWEKVNIRVPDYTENLDIWVTDVIFRLRMELLKDLLDRKTQAIKEIPADRFHEIEAELEEAYLYNQLKGFFGEVLNQVLML